MVGDLAAHAAERADGIHLTVHHLRAHQAAWTQSPGGAGLHALAARHTGAVAHGVVEVEHDARVSPAALRANDAIDLLFATGANTAVALDAGVEVDHHGGMRVVVQRGACCRRLCWVGDCSKRLQRWPHLHTQSTRPVAQLSVRTLGIPVNPPLPGGRCVGEQHFQHHVLALARTGTVGLHHHAGLGAATATRGQGALALNLDHASAAIAVGAVAGLVTQMGNLDAQTMRGFPQGFASAGLHGLTIELNVDAAHGRVPVLVCLSLAPEAEAEAEAEGRAEDDSSRLED